MKCLNCGKELEYQYYETRSRSAYSFDEVIQEHENLVVKVDGSVHCFFDTETHESIEHYHEGTANNE